MAACRGSAHLALVPHRSLMDLMRFLEALVTASGLR